MDPIRGSSAYNDPSINSANPAQAPQAAAETHSSGHPTSLTTAMLSDHAIKSLNYKEGQGSEHEKKLATFAKQAIGSRQLQISTNQTASDIAQFGMKNGRDVLAIITKLNEHAAYDILSVGLRIGTQAPVSMKLPSPATAVAGDARRSTELPRLANETPLHAAGSAAPHLPEQGESSSAVPTDTSINPLLIANRKTVINLVTKLNKWDQKECLGIIEEKLKAEPPGQQQLLLQDLNKRLSGMAAAAKPACIVTWADTATKERIIQDRDTRTPHERTLQDKISQHLGNKNFEDVFEKICLSLEITERVKVRDVSIVKGKYRSPLFARVFSGKLEPLAAIQNLKQHLDSVDARQRYDAILSWSNE